MNISHIFNKSNFTAFTQAAKKTDLFTLFYHCFHTLTDEFHYTKWYHKTALTQAQLQTQSKTIFPYAPLISIVVPTYCTPIPFFKEMVESVKKQTYTNWELCIADASPNDSPLRTLIADYARKDTRMKVTFLDTNHGISTNTNSALKLASGTFIGLLDHDDLLAPNALFEIVTALNRNPHIDVIYTDEDKVSHDASRHYYPNFKPDYNKYLLRCNNYICHFFVFHKKIYDKIGAFDPSYDGSQDYNYILAATRQAACVYHIPKILYHWRVHEQSVAGNPAQKMYCYIAAKKALENDLTSEQVKGTVSLSSPLGFYSTSYDAPQKASILLLSLEPHFNFQNKTAYTVDYSQCFTFSDIWKQIKATKATYCIILNRGIPSIPSEIFAKTISHLQYPHIGAVTYKIIDHARILALGTTYRNNTLTGCYQSIPKHARGYYGRAVLTQYVPFCSPYAMAFCTEQAFAFIRQNSPESLIDFSTLFSLYLYTQHQYTLGLADITLKCNKPIPFNNYKLGDQHKLNEIKKASRLYRIPPYLS